MQNVSGMLQVQEMSTYYQKSRNQVNIIIIVLNILYKVCVEGVSRGINLTHIPCVFCLHLNYTGSSVFGRIKH